MTVRRVNESIPLTVYDGASGGRSEVCGRGFRGKKAVRGIEKASKEINKCVKSYLIDTRECVWGFFVVQ